jgi:hypothetical protein
MRRSLASYWYVEKPIAKLRYLPYNRIVDELRFKSAAKSSIFCK